MTLLFSILIIAHIAGGATGLLSGTVAAIAKKGQRIHKLSGVVFFFGMLCSSITAIIISQLPDHKNLFLMAVGGFTFYMILSGYRAIWLKRNSKKQLNVIGTFDYLLMFFAAAFGLFLIALSVTEVRAGRMFGVVPLVFGLVCMNYAMLDYRLIAGKTTVKLSWISNHITRMMGALIASYTAFLVVNVHIEQSWILWLLPTLIGTILIIRFLKKFAPRKSVQTINKLST